MTSKHSHPGAGAASTEDLVEQVERLQRELDSLRAGLAHAQRLSTLGTLSAMLAHEYANLLTPVASYTQLALSRPGDRELAEKALRKAHVAAGRAADLSRTVLGFAGPEAEEAGTADLGEVVDASLACLGRDLERDGIRLEQHLPDMKLAIPALHLQQVLVNLLINARRAMTDGGTIRLSGRIEGAMGAVDVADTGPGVPPRVLERLFEPFVRGSGEQGGHGLGLCICRELLTRAGGHISVTSRLGEGATFHLRVPLARGKRGGDQA